MRMFLGLVTVLPNPVYGLRFTEVKLFSCYAGMLEPRCGLRISKVILLYMVYILLDCVIATDLERLLLTASD